jgi:uncharacterized protein
VSEIDPYEGLLKSLKAQSDWPMVYLFKFIVPNDNQKLAQAEALFGEAAQVSLNQSKTGKYISVSARELMLNPDSVIERYRQAAKIEGIISL